MTVAIDTVTSDAEAQAQRQYEKICSLVAALKCDFDMLDELQFEHRLLSEAVDAALQDIDRAQWALADFDETHADTVESSHFSKRNALEIALEAAHSAHAEAVAALAQWDDSDDGRQFRELLDAAGDYTDQDEVQTAIFENPLSVEVRSDWAATSDDWTAGEGEFRIVLCTGGPHVEITGELSSGAPRSVKMWYFDWSTPRTQLLGIRSDVLETYAAEFFVE